MEIIEAVPNSQSALAEARVGETPTSCKETKRKNESDPDIIKACHGDPLMRGVVGSLEARLEKAGGSGGAKARLMRHLRAMGAQLETEIRHLVLGTQILIAAAMIIADRRRVAVERQDPDCASHLSELGGDPETIARAARGAPLPTFDKLVAAVESGQVDDDGKHFWIVKWLDEVEVDMEIGDRQEGVDQSSCQYLTRNLDRFRLDDESM